MKTDSQSRLRPILSIDYGRKRTGLAKCESEYTVTPLPQLKTTDAAFWQKLDRLIESLSPQLLLIGIPYHRDGREGELSTEIRNFARRLEKKFPEIGQVFRDESFSSIEAESIMNRLNGRFQSVQGRKKKKMQLDSRAAAVILKAYIESDSD